MADQFTRTVTPTGVGGAGSLETAAGQVQKANVWEQAMGLVQNVQETTQALSDVEIKKQEAIKKAQEEDNKIMQRNKATLDARELMAMVGQKNAEDADEDYRNNIQRVMEDETLDDEYKQNYINKLETVANNAAKDSYGIKVGRQAKFEASGILDEVRLGNISGTDWANNMHNKTGVSQTVFRDNLIIEESEYIKSKLYTARDEETLNSILSEHQEFKNKLNDPMFYLSQSKGDFGKILKSSEDGIKNVKEEMLKNFKENANNRLWNANGDEDIVIGDESKGIVGAYDFIPNKEWEQDVYEVYGQGTVQSKNYIRETLKKKQTYDNARAGLKSVLVTDVIPNNLKENKVYMKERVKQVSNAALISLLNNEGNKFNSILIANNEQASDIGDTIVTAFNNYNDPKVLNQFMANVENAGKYPNGGAAVNQTFKDKDYTSIIVTNAIKDMDEFGGDSIKARNWLVSSKSNIAVTSQMSKDNWERVNDKMEKLGDKAGRYEKIMQDIHKYNPNLVEKLYKKVYDHIDSSSKTIKVKAKDTGVFDLELDTKGVYDVSMGQLNHGIDELAGENWLPEKLMEDGKYTKISVAPNGDVIREDALGIKDLKTKKEVDEIYQAKFKELEAKEENKTEFDLATDRLTKSFADASAEFVVGVGQGFTETWIDPYMKLSLDMENSIKDFIKSGTSTGATSSIKLSGSKLRYEDGTTTERISKGFGKSIGTLVDKLGAGSINLINSISDFLSGEVEEPEVAKNVVADLTIEALENKKEKLVVTNPIVDKEKITMEENIKIENAIEKNKLEVQRIDLAQKKIRKQTAKDVRPKLLNSISIKEGGYSDNKDDKGNYHNNKFVGTNHGISAPVLAEYLGRTPTVEDMKNLSKEDAQEVLWNRYYEKKGLENLPSNVQEIVFHGVVTGEGHAIKVMQELMGITADGSVGPNTIKAMKKAKFTKKEFKDALLKKYKTFKGWKTQGKGWTNRFEDLAK